MELKIDTVENRKILKNEHVKLTVINDCNLSDYLLFDTTYNEDGKVSNEWRHVFLFPEQDVKKGEIIRLFTGKGKNRIDVAEGGHPKTHNIFWGLGESVWNKRSDVAYLFKIAAQAPPFIVDPRERIVDILRKHGVTT